MIFLIITITEATSVNLSCLQYLFLFLSSFFSGHNFYIVRVYNAYILVCNSVSHIKEILVLS